MILKTQTKDLMEPAARELSAVVADAVCSAKAAGLHYVTDDVPGIRRAKKGQGFRYLQPGGRAVRDSQTLNRIRSLAIPPAWTGVWICPSPNGHLQATGRDARKRKQYRYHPRWRQVRDETKYEHMIEFGTVLPKIRRRTREDLRAPGLPRQKVLAAVVQLLERTLIRIGNEEYAQNNHSFGLTTLQDRHAAINGSKMYFEFKGKSGKYHRVELRDPILARIVKQCRDLPGAELFQYLDEHGQRQKIDSGDVNEYLREITGRDFTAKDFRTWYGTVLAMVALRSLPACSSATKAKKNVAEAVKAVAEILRNTPAVCRKCYIHPAILDLYSSQGHELFGAPAKPCSKIRGLSQAENQMLDLLKHAGARAKRLLPGWQTPLR